MRLVLRGGRLLDPSARRDGVGEVLIVDGQLAAVGQKVESAGAQVIELDGAWVAPGFIDLHSVVRDEADLAAALRGGFTTVIAAPESPRLRSDGPVLLAAAPLTRRLEGDELGEVPSDAPCLSQGFRPLVRSGVLRRALQYSASHGKLLVLHAEDPSLTGSGVLGEGLTATRESNRPGTANLRLAEDYFIAAYTWWTSSWSSRVLRKAATCLRSLSESSGKLLAR